MKRLASVYTRVDLARNSYRLGRLVRDDQCLYGVLSILRVICNFDFVRVYAIYGACNLIACYLLKRNWVKSECYNGKGLVRLALTVKRNSYAEMEGVTC